MRAHADGLAAEVLKQANNKSLCLSFDWGIAVHLALCKIMEEEKIMTSSGAGWG